MSATAIVELRSSLAALVKGDGVLDNLLSGLKVFALEAPSGASLNYLVIGPVILDTRDSYYQQSGRRHRRRLSAWARTLGTAEEIYARLVTLLDGKRLNVDGHVMQTTALDFIAGPAMDEDRKAWGIHADWTVKTLES